jgi:hypothetical protein
VLYGGMTFVLELCQSGVTVVLQCSYCSATVVLEWCYNGLTVVVPAGTAGSSGRLVSVVL